MTAVATAAPENCPDCKVEMNFEGHQVLHFNGGRGDVPVLRFNCPECRIIHNIVASERGLAQG